MSACFNQFFTRRLFNHVKPSRGEKITCGGGGVLSDGCLAGVLGVVVPHGVISHTHVLRSVRARLRRRCRPFGRFSF